MGVFIRKLFKAIDATLKAEAAKAAAKKKPAAKKPAVKAKAAKKPASKIKRAAAAAKITIAEAGEIVPVGELDPESVVSEHRLLVTFLIIAPQHLAAVRNTLMQLRRLHQRQPDVVLAQVEALRQDTDNGGRSVI